MNSLVGKTYYVKTFGCQMNLHDSERVEGLLEQNGCICVPEPEQADIVVFMTCCVRENADQRLYGQASAMVSAPKPPCGKRVVAIGGCIAQRDGEKIREHIPTADVVFGTSALKRLLQIPVKTLRSILLRRAVDSPATCPADAHRSSMHGSPS